jgi:hypothetical protein
MPVLAAETGIPHMRAAMLAGPEAAYHCAAVAAQGSGADFRHASLVREEDSGKARAAAAGIAHPAR